MILMIQDGTNIDNWEHHAYSRGWVAPNYPVPALQTYVSWWHPRFDGWLLSMSIYVGPRRWEWLASPRTGSTRLIGEP